MKALVNNITQHLQHTMCIHVKANQEATESNNKLALQVEYSYQLTTRLKKLLMMKLNKLLT